MLPLIRSFATEFTGLQDGSSADPPVSGGPGSRFSGLLNQSVAGKLPAHQGQPSGQVLPPDGRILPSGLAGVADLNGTEFPMLEFELPVGEFFDQGPQPIESAASGSILYRLGLESGPMGDVLAGELSGNSERQPPGIGSAIDRLAEIQAGNGVELSPADFGQPVESTVPVTALPLGIALDQRLIDRNGPIAQAGDAELGSVNRADAGLSGTELLLKGPVPTPQSPAAVSVIEQPGLAAASMQIAPMAAFELNKAASQLNDGAAGRPTGGAAEGAASVNHTSLAGSASIATTVASSAPAGTAAGGTSTLHIGTPLQDAAWSNELGHRVLLMSGQQLQSARIQISPAELGPITVNLVVDDGSADLTFQAQHAVTRDVIEQALPRLREMLSENGLTLGNASVSDQGVREDGFGHASDGADPSESVDDETMGLERSREVQPGRILKGLLDTFV